MIVEPTFGEIEQHCGEFRAERRCVHKKQTKELQQYLCIKSWTVAVESVSLANHAKGVFCRAIHFGT